MCGNAGAVFFCRIAFVGRPVVVRIFFVQFDHVSGDATQCEAGMDILVEAAAMDIIFPSPLTMV